MDGTKIKAAMAASLAGIEPTQAEIADAVGEVVDMMASIANSLERIAIAQETAQF